MSEGSIIAIVISAHMPRKAAAAANQEPPQSGVQAVDIDQPPAIGTSPICAMVRQIVTVAIVLAMNRRMQMARKLRP